jgi:hypothetical protein
MLLARTYAQKLKPFCAMAKLAIEKGACPHSTYSE